MPLAICATPIGNLGDVTLRVLDELRAADVILCEDTRRTRILLARHGIEARLESHHRHNEAARTPRVLERLRGGRASRTRVGRRAARRERPWSSRDRGCRSRRGGGDRAPRRISGRDRARRQRSGGRPLPVRRVSPAAGGRAAHACGASSADGVGQSWPSSRPRRLPGSLRVLAEVLPDRRAAVCRELTKRFEEVVRGSLEELAARFVEAPRGEITLVLGPTTTSASARVDDDARAAVSDLVAAGASRRAAAEVVARLTGTSRNALYRDSL